MTKIAIDGTQKSEEALTMSPSESALDLRFPQIQEAIS